MIGESNGPNAVPKLRFSGHYESRELSKVRRADPAPRAIKATARSNFCACLRLTNSAGISIASLAIVFLFLVLMFGHG